MPDDEDIQAWLNTIARRFNADTGPSCADSGRKADELRDRYDADADGTINLIEVSTAIDDYFRDERDPAKLTLDRGEHCHRPVLQLERKLIL